MERTARQKASARPSSSATVGRRCAAAAVCRWALVIGGRDAADRRRRSSPLDESRKGEKGAPAVEGQVWNVEYE